MIKFLETSLSYFADHKRYALEADSHAFANPEAGTDRTARLVYPPPSAARAKVAIADFISTHGARR